MKSSSNALPFHLRRLHVAGDFNGDRNIVTGKVRLAAVIINARSFVTSRTGLALATVIFNDAPRQFFFGSLENDLLRNTQNSFGTSHNGNTKNSERSEHINSKPYVMGCHLQLASQTKTLYQN